MRFFSVMRGRKFQYAVIVCSQKHFKNDICTSDCKCPFYRERLINFKINLQKINSRKKRKNSPEKGGCRTAFRSSGIYYEKDF